MHIVWHDDFNRSDYATDNASAPGRLEGVMRVLRAEGGWPVVEPLPAGREDLLRAHTPEHVATIEKDARLFAMALLAAGGAIRAAELAVGGETAFACVRPPGHHAGRSTTWGYCAFANVALALLRLRAEGRIQSAFVLDFDAHTGDGTMEVLREWPAAHILNPYADDSKQYLALVETHLRLLPDVDIVAVSAGFDSYIHDAGRKLSTDDFYALGWLLRLFGRRMGHQRCFAVLEGGYYLPDLGKNVLAFCRGLG